MLTAHRVERFKELFLRVEQALAVAARRQSQADCDGTVGKAINFGLHPLLSPNGQKSAALSFLRPFSRTSNGRHTRQQVPVLTALARCGHFAN